MENTITRYMYTKQQPEIKATEKMQRQTNKYNRKSRYPDLVGHKIMVGKNMHFFFYDSSKINPWFGF